MIRLKRWFGAALSQESSKPTSIQRRMVRLVWYIVLTGLVLVYSIPAFGVIITSFKTNREIAQAGVVDRARSCPV